jgi:hypothetical protein
MGRAGRPLGYPQQQVLRTRRTVCRAEAGDSRPRAKGVTYSNTGAREAGMAAGARVVCATAADAWQHCGGVVQA